VREVFRRLDRLTPESVGATIEAPGEVPFLRFDLDALELFVAWRTELELRVRRDQDSPALQAHLAKFRSLIPSLALLIHLADGGTAAVGEQALLRACGWADYLESHARRVYSAVLAREGRAAKALAQHILAGDLEDGFSVRDVYRHHWTDLSDRDDADIAVKTLLDLDWLREVREQGPGRPRAGFQINPRLKEVAREVA
jgi:putative DNA primase/helicase